MKKGARCLLGWSPWCGHTLEGATVRTPFIGSPHPGGPLPGGGPASAWRSPRRVRVSRSGRLSARSMQGESPACERSGRGPSLGQGHLRDTKTARGLAVKMGPGTGSVSDTPRLRNAGGALAAPAAPDSLFGSGRDRVGNRSCLLRLPPGACFGAMDGLTSVSPHPLPG